MGVIKFMYVWRGRPKGDVMKRNSFLLCTPMNAQLYLNVVTRGLLDLLNSYSRTYISFPNLWGTSCEINNICTELFLLSYTVFRKMDVWELCPLTSVDL